MSKFTVVTNSNKNHGILVRIKYMGSEYYMSPRQATAVLHLSTTFAAKRKQGSLTENGNWESGRVTLSYNARNQLATITTFGTVLPHDLTPTPEPTCSITLQYSQVKDLAEALSVVLGLSPASNIDGKFLGLWINNVAVGMLMVLASLVLFLPPMQRTRWLYQWLIHTADDVAVNNERKIVQANLGAAKC